MNHLTIARSHPVLAFAGEEWNRLMNWTKKHEEDLLASGISPAAEPAQVWIGTWNDLEESKPGLLQSSVREQSRFSDDFIIAETDHGLVLSGKSERAALYAVYQFAQQQWGLNWVYPVEEPAISKPNTGGAEQSKIQVYSPRIERRGFVFENINEPDYLNTMIDWFGKNKINEMFFTFHLWDQVGGEVGPELIKRGIDVTLGGHSLMFFLKKGKDRYPNQTAGDPYTAKAQVDFQDSEWQRLLLEDITAYCHGVPNLTRISLWPEDIAAQEEDGFLASYLLFTEKLDENLREAGRSVSVEHIAYNAGLSWSMLERRGTQPSNTVNTLLAYWGRDYRYGYEDSPQETDQRAMNALLDWSNAIQQTGRELTIFEYYSDHFMFTQLFPFMPRRIMGDIAFYEKLQVHGIVDLVVPYRGPDSYPWKWVHSFNSYVFCRALWSDDFEGIIRDFYTYYPQEERESVRNLYQVLESKLGQITYWNTPLFPARIVDPEKSKATKEQKEQILAALADIKVSVQGVLQQASFTPGSEAQRFGQHILDFADSLSKRWIEQ